MTKQWKMSPADLFSQGPVVPVLVIKELEHAVPIAKALVAGGIKVLEVTLRTEIAIEAIKKIAEEVPGAIVGAGTVANEADLKAVEEAGAQFAISPGSTRELLQAGKDSSIALIAGVSSTSELMKGLEFGYDHFKFFPAEASGGVKAIKSISGPVPQVVFCPTGGINPENYQDYLGLSNVRCVGGSWLVPDNVVANGEWEQITDLAKQAVAGAN